MFFKNLIFEDFWLIEPVAWPIENAIKILVTICLARSVLDWSTIFWPIENWPVSFLKDFSLTFSSHFSNLFKSFFPFLARPIQSKFFFLVAFCLKSSKGFCLLAWVSLFYPFFSFKSSFSCSVLVFLLRFSNWICFRVFNFWVVFFHIWFMSFCL